MSKTHGKKQHYPTILEQTHILPNPPFFLGNSENPNPSSFIMVGIPTLKYEKFVLEIRVCVSLFKDKLN